MKYILFLLLGGSFVLNISAHSSTDSTRIITDTIHPRVITYRVKQLMANSQIVRTKEDDSLVVVFDQGRIFSTMSLRPDLTHLTDTKEKVRYSSVHSKNLFKIEKVNQDTTNYKYTYVKLRDTLIWNRYVGYKHKFTMKDNFTGTTYTVVLYECPEIKIGTEFMKYYFSELFFMKIPIKLSGGVIKALAEQRINDKPVSRDELLLLRFDDDVNWPQINFETPMKKNYTLMLPDGTIKEKKYAKELIEHLTGRKDYPNTPYKEIFTHE